MYLEAPSDTRGFGFLETLLCPYISTVTLLATYLDLRRPLVIRLAGKGLNCARAVLKNKSGPAHTPKVSIGFRDSASGLCYWYVLRVRFQGPGSKKEGESR